MAFTKAYAKILAGMLPPEQHIALKFIAGKGDHLKAHATPDVIDDLVNLELVRVTETAEDKPRTVAVLTAKGKKVAEFV